MIGVLVSVCSVHYQSLLTFSAQHERVVVVTCHSVFVGLSFNIGFL